MKNFFKQLYSRFFEDQCAMRAASLTFTTLLSIVPLLIFIFYLLSFFPHLQVAGQEIEQFILQNFVASSAKTIAGVIQDFLMHTHVLSWLNMLSLASIALLLIFNIVDTMNGVWHVKLIKIKNYLAFSFILYLIIIVISPILFALLLLLSSYLASLQLLSDVLQINIVHKPVVWAMPFLIEWVAFTFFHWVMPHCRVYFRYAAIAGLLTTVFFEIAKCGFVAYFHFFPTYQLIYGALAMIPIFFLWVYISWLIVIVCALICAVIQNDNQNT